jgi:hypothetical protein
MNAPYLVLLAASLVFGAHTSSEAALLARAGGAAVYDTDLNITWLADANLAASNPFGVAGINAGNMNWDTTKVWIGALNAAAYLGVSNWRLPTTTEPDPSCDLQTDPRGGFPLQGNTYNCIGSEMGHLFYVELGGTALHSIATTHNASYGLFNNLPALDYWSGTGYEPDATRAWAFGFLIGRQGAGSTGNGFFAWAVAPGDPLNAVPAPTAIWLFVSALAALGSIRRVSE